MIIELKMDLLWFTVFLNFLHKISNTVSVGSNSFWKENKNVEIFYDLQYPEAALLKCP